MTAYFAVVVLKMERDPLELAGVSDELKWRLHPHFDVVRTYIAPADLIIEAEQV